MIEKVCTTTTMMIVRVKSVKLFVDAFCIGIENFNSWVPQHSVLQYNAKNKIAARVMRCFCCCLYWIWWIWPNGEYCFQHFKHLHRKKPYCISSSFFRPPYTFSLFIVFLFQCIILGGLYVQENASVWFRFPSIHILFFLVRTTFDIRTH